MLKKIIFLIFISSCLCTFSHAETEKELFDSGVSFFKQNQYQQAIDKFSKLIELAPNNADAYKNRGVSYMKLNKFDLAIKDFETAKKLFPELKGLYSNLGVAWYYKKEYEKAIENYDIEIEMAPDNYVAFFNRALCLAELDRNEEALDNLIHTLELKPDFYWAICYKADLLAQTGEKIKAIEAYEDAIKVDPENTYAPTKLAKLRQKTEGDEPLAAAKKTPEIKKGTGSEYAVQAGAFLNQANADKLKTKLINNGFDSRVLTLEDSKKRTWYLVRSGNYENQESAQKALLALEKKLGIKPVVRPSGTW